MLSYVFHFQVAWQFPLPIEVEVCQEHVDGEVDSELRDGVVGNCCPHVSSRVMEDNPGGGVT